MKPTTEVLEIARKLVQSDDPISIQKIAGMQLAVLLEIRDLLAERPNVAVTPTRVKVER